MAKVYLALAILFEVIGTSSLKASTGFTRLYPSILVVLGYGASFYFLSLVFKTMQVGVVYAVWSGLGIVLITLIGFIIYRETPDLPAILGLCLIIAGVAVINLFSDTVH
ncbi:DMT family transporter [Limisalsivibrio acetivorans]|uniref:DMT family transporter n=1 Tax=Limisalsivibrio acetivorans TaxID=1304888 RepID=UPI0003B560D6|nr:multidrug efflux SMR transporter [Limisalsivibrio acetivorans]